MSTTARADPDAYPRRQEEDFNEVGRLTHIPLCIGEDAHVATKQLPDSF